MDVLAVGSKMENWTRMPTVVSKLTAPVLGVAVLALVLTIEFTPATFNTQSLPLATMGRKSGNPPSTSLPHFVGATKSNPD